MTFDESYVRHTHTDAVSNCEYDMEKKWDQIFSENCVLIYEGFTSKGKPCGTGTAYFANGNKYMEGTWGVKGLLSGREYYPNGQLRFEGKYCLNFGYGPNFPEKGRYFSETGDLLFNGSIPYMKSGVGYPVSNDKRLGPVPQKDAPRINWLSFSDCE